MIIMPAAKGFSLIETLVAVALASLAALALLQVISRASHTSAHAISRFNSSLLMGVAAAEVNESMDGRTLSADEILKTRYQIDHPLIIQSLKETSYRISVTSEEVINPLAMIQANVLDTTNAKPITIQKVLLDNASERKTFFRINAGTQ